MVCEVLCYARLVWVCRVLLFASMGWWFRSGFPMRFCLGFAVGVLGLVGLHYLWGFSLDWCWCWCLILVVQCCELLFVCVLICVCVVANVGFGGDLFSSFGGGAVFAECCCLLWV